MKGLYSYEIEERYYRFYCRTFDGLSRDLCCYITEYSPIKMVYRFYFESPKIRDYFRCLCNALILQINKNQSKFEKVVEE